MRITTFAAGVALLLAVTARSGRADVTHIVEPGHTLEAIAHRYHVSVEAIALANHLKDQQHLKPGQELVIPGVEAPSKKEAAGEGKGRGTQKSASVGKSLAPRGHNETGVIHAFRAGEEFRFRIRDGHGRIAPNALHQFAQMSRQGNATHPPDPRLIALVGIVSDHFGGKTIEVVSGYRAYSPTQYTAHSNHNAGKALDFRIEGVPNETLRDFCRTLRNAGCGYYPNSTFVHLDARDTKAYWVDWSHPGEAPQYEKPGVAADEGTSDVPVDPSPIANPPAPTPAGGSPETPGNRPLGEGERSL